VCPECAPEADDRRRLPGPTPRNAITKIALATLCTLFLQACWATAALAAEAPVDPPQPPSPSAEAASTVVVVVVPEEPVAPAIEPVPLEPAGPVIVRIEWKGLEAFEPEEIEDRILTTAQPRFAFRFWQPKRRLDAFTLDEDVERILEAYREIGHFSASVETRIEELEGDRIAVRFEIEEGPAIRLKAWKVAVEQEENEEYPLTAEERARLVDRIDIADHPAFGSKLYREERKALMEVCGEIGFPHARLTGGADVDPERESARVSWVLHLGPRTFFGPIQIRGLSKIDENIVRRELRFAAGDPFSTSTLEKSERKLIETGLFRSVAIGREPAREGEKVVDSDTIPIEVRVDESPLRSLRGSIGYGTEDGPRGEISLVWRNFLGQARRLQARGFASLLDAGFEASLGQPYIWGQLGRGDFAVSALRQSRPGYEAFVTGSTGLLTLYPDWDRESPWSLSLGPGYELAQIYDFEIDIPEDQRGPRQSVIANWYTTARYQRVDDRLNPRSGVRIQLANEVGGSGVGSDLDYHRWELDMRAYVPTGPIVWAFKAVATTLDPIGQNLGDVPLTRRLYSGGTNSVRGFGFQKLGPEDSRNDPTGGLSRMELGAEIRVPVWGRFGLVGFIDAGDVRRETWTWKPTELRASAGPGLRIDTPVGPLRFDFAFLLNRPTDTDPWRFHLSVGHAF
jgi:outer membrane protein insertion porin family/translocation and assembly module TamA